MVWDNKIGIWHTHTAARRGGRRVEKEQSEFQYANEIMEWPTVPHSADIEVLFFIWPHTPQQSQLIYTFVICFIFGRTR